MAPRRACSRSRATLAPALSSSSANPSASLRLAVRIERPWRLDTLATPSPGLDSDPSVVGAHRTSDRPLKGSRRKRSTRAVATPGEAPPQRRARLRNAVARFDRVRDVSDETRDQPFRRTSAAAPRFGAEARKAARARLRPACSSGAAEAERTPSYGRKARSGGRASSGASSWGVWPSPLSVTSSASGSAAR